MKVEIKKSPEIRLHHSSTFTSYTKSTKIFKTVALVFNEKAKSYVSIYNIPIASRLSLHKCSYQYMYLSTKKKYFLNTSLHAHQQSCRSHMHRCNTRNISRRSIVVNKSPFKNFIAFYLIRFLSCMHVQFSKRSDDLHVCKHLFTCICQSPSFKVIFVLLHPIIIIYGNGDTSCYLLKKTIDSVYTAKYRKMHIN